MKIPITVLTGFLGSGKTTLLRSVLTQPDMSDTAVIINEAGEMSLDHLLLETVEESILELPNGCLCCVRRLDILTTVRALIDRRDSGAIQFKRILIETSGLADPAPILYTLAADPMLGHVLHFTAVVTAVDAMAGVETLRNYPESACQIAVADRILITKTDIAPPTRQLTSLLDGLNGWADRIELPGETDRAGLLFSQAPAVAARRRLSAQAIQTDAVHTPAITTLSMIFSTPPTRLAFAQALGRLASERGADLLRVKGLIAFSDRPDRIAVIHAVQHTIYRPEWLERWPDGDTRSRLVFIARNLAADEIFERFTAFMPEPWTESDTTGAYPCSI